MSAINTRVKCNLKCNCCERKCEGSFVLDFEDAPRHIFQCNSCKRFKNIKAPNYKLAVAALIIGR